MFVVVGLREQSFLREALEHLELHRHHAPTIVLSNRLEFPTTAGYGSNWIPIEPPREWPLPAPPRVFYWIDFAPPPEVLVRPAPPRARRPAPRPVPTPWPTRLRHFARRAA
jgi:hypothetical protein